MKHEDSEYVRDFAYFMNKHMDRFTPQETFDLFQSIFDIATNSRIKVAQKKDRDGKIVECACSELADHITMNDGRFVAWCKECLPSDGLYE